MNTTNIKFKGKLAGYFTSPLKLGIILIIANILIYVMHWPSGLVLSLFLIVFFVVAGYLYLGSRATILNEMVNFATEYGSLQNSFLKNLQLPYAMLDEKGNFIWMNEAFEKLVGREKTYHGGITTLFPEIKPTDLPTEEKAEVGIPLEIEGLYYKAKLTRVLMDSLSDKNEIIDTGGREALTALYLFDETAEQLALQEVEDSSLVIGLIYIDNYDEVMESTPDENRSLFGGVLDRMVNRYVSSVDGICSKTEKDKYLVILRKKSLQQLEENRFSLLSDMKAS
ncbi:MAG: DHH family phosphoesterase, partial [Lachnospiraceae bacterium]|nr:DHH family phosphoesterase [Lachnospiraceae bacterium]